MKADPAHLSRLVSLYDEEAERSVPVAQDAIDEAIRELQQISIQLDLASQGEPYLRTGEIRGVRAGLVFAAFAAIEAAATTRRLIAQSTDES